MEFVKITFVATIDPDEIFVEFIFVIVLLSATTLAVATFPDVIPEDDNIVFPIVADVIDAFVESNDDDVKLFNAMLDILIFPTVKLDTFAFVEAILPNVAFVEFIFVDNCDPIEAFVALIVPETSPIVTIFDDVILVVNVLSALIPDDDITILPTDAVVEMRLEMDEFVTISFVVIIDEAVMLDNEILDTLILPTVKLDTFVFVDTILPIVALEPVKEPDETDVETTVPSVELVAETLVAETVPDEIPLDTNAFPADT